MAKPQERELTGAELAEAQRAFKNLLAYLNSQVYSPPNKKEKERMARAIEFDLTHLRVYLGISIEDRLAQFGRLGYLYDGVYSPPPL